MGIRRSSGSASATTRSSPRSGSPARCHISQRRRGTLASSTRPTGELRSLPDRVAKRREVLAARLFPISRVRVALDDADTREEVREARRHVHQLGAHEEMHVETLLVGLEPLRPSLAKYR